MLSGERGTSSRSSSDAAGLDAEEVQKTLLALESRDERLGEDENRDQARVNSLQETIVEKSTMVEQLTLKLNETESRLADIEQERQELQQFKEYASTALEKFPTHVDSLCSKMEEIFHGATGNMHVRIDCLANLASSLRNAIVFEQAIDISIRKLGNRLHFEVGECFSKGLPFAEDRDPA